MLIFSMPLRPGPAAHSGGAFISGGPASGASSILENSWTRRVSVNDASLYANYAIMVKDSACIAQVDQPYLLPKADAGSGGECGEDERVRDEVLVQALIQEAVRVEDEDVGAPEIFTAVHNKGRKDASNDHIQKVCIMDVKAYLRSPFAYEDRLLRTRLG